VFVDTFDLSQFTWRNLILNLSSWLILQAIYILRQQCDFLSIYMSYMHQWPPGGQRNQRKGNRTRTNSALVNDLLVSDIEMHFPDGPHGTTVCNKTSTNCRTQPQRGCCHTPHLKVPKVLRVLLHLKKSKDMYVYRKDKGI